MTLEKVFNYIKNTNIAAKVLRFGLGVLLMVLGILLSFIYDNPTWIVIAISLCMAESVLIISLTIRKSHSRERLEQSLLQRYFGGFKRISDSSDISFAYKILGYKEILLSREAYYTIVGQINGIDVASAKFKCVIKPHLFKTYYLNIYTFNYMDKEIADLNEIKSPVLKNYRYEVRDNKLYIATISSGKDLSLEPTNYKCFKDWKNAIKAERAFLDIVCNKMEE